MKKYLSKFAVFSFVLLALSLLIYVLSLRVMGVSDFVNGTVSVAIRFLLSSLTVFLPFSFFELLIILSPVLLIIIIVTLIKRGRTRRDRIRGTLAVLSVISLIVTSYIFTLGVAYHTTPLSEKIGIEEYDEVSCEELYDTLNIIVDGINSCVGNLSFDGEQTHMSYSHSELSERLISAYDVLNGKYRLCKNFSSRVKPVYFSTVMSDLGISGIYSFFTGEANVNVEYPDYCLPFTAAHELAHQRGIGRENEANFVAFLVCISSPDEYIRYSGYLNMYEYLASDLYRADPELYASVLSRLSEVARADIRAANAVYQKHKDSPLGKINDKLNDAYLKANGTDGIVSYGYVVRLAVAYYKTNNE